MIALAITAALSVVGALLVTALFVVPALTTRLFAERMLSWQLASVVLMLLAAGLAALAGVAGLYLSYYAGTAGGASVALAIVVIYLLSLPVGRLRAARRPLPIPGGVTIG